MEVLYVGCKWMLPYNSSHIEFDQPKLRCKSRFIEGLLEGLSLLKSMES